jgi:hypothetical protein
MSSRRGKPPANVVVGIKAGTPMGASMLMAVYGVIIVMIKWELLAPIYVINDRELY